MIKKLIVPLIALALLVPVVAGCGSLPRSAVASVNGKVITREDLDRQVEELKAQFGGQGGFPEPGTEEYNQFQRQIAQQLVNQEIIFFEADKMGITVSDEEVTQQLEQYQQQSGGEEQFRARLEQLNLTEDRVKDQIRQSLIFQKIYPEVTKDAAQVTDEQALAYYNENQALFQQPETLKVRHILVKDEATANQVKARLDAGEDFATVAKEVSTDPGSKEQGGDLGQVSKEGYTSSGSQLVTEFVNAMNQLSAGQISAPVKTQFGYHIIQVTEVKPAGTQSFEEAKEQIKQQLALENQRTAFEAWFESIKGNYEVIYAEEFNPDVTTPEETGTVPQTTETQTQPQPAPAQ